MLARWRILAVLIAVLWLAGWGPADARRTVDDCVSQPDADGALLARRADERLIETVGATGLSGDAVAVLPAPFRVIQPDATRGHDHVQLAQLWVGSPRGPPMIG
ncbi:hypothetical protein [Enhygromyxa salina]|uniref:hypothetical protein n=1 Tax=Enhygromyxa salina TaxID=215803 RepID=UPI0011B238C7|nr:hypothetical protein [Enhygromyxa salina]